LYAAGGGTDSCAYSALYYCLSTLPDKPATVIEMLFEAADHPDQNWAERALFGLTQGIPKPYQSSVADFASSRLQRLGPKEREQAVQIVRHYGTPEQIAALRN
jgi:hypothetical protein